MSGCGLGVFVSISALVVIPDYKLCSGIVFTLLLTIEARHIRPRLPSPNKEAE